MKTILITGANGFVGTNLYHALAGEYHLLGLDITREGPYPSEDIYQWNDLNCIPPADTILHLAGKAHDTSGTTDEKEYFDVNLGLTQQIFDFFLWSSAEKFIFFSSVKAVADTLPGEWLTEEAIPEPKTAYGRSKLAAEQYILKKLAEFEPQSRKNAESERRSVGASGRRGVGERERGIDTELNQKSPITNHHSPIQQQVPGRNQSEIPNPKSQIRNPKSVYILRPAMIYGPGNKGNLNMLYKVVRWGIPWPLGAFENQRSFTSVVNLSFIIRQLLERNIEPGIYNITDDDPVSTRAIIHLMAESLGRKPRILNIPAGWVHVAARLGDLLHAPLTSERLKKLTENYCVSNKKIKKALGIDYLPVLAKEGLERTIGRMNDRTIER